jgi:hypothetical protein
LFESGGTNTALAAAIYDFSAITSTAGFKVPVAAGNTATAAGAIDFDSTNKNYHSYTDGADSIFASYASAPTNGFIPKALISSGNLLLTSSLLDDGHTTANTLNYSGTGGMAAPQFVSTGTTAGFADFPEGSSSLSTVPCSTATSICIQAPVTVVSYLVNLPGVVGTGTLIGNNASSVRTEAYSGDANHSAVVTTGSGTSVGSTALCSSANCPAGTYRVNVYIDVTTACGTSGTYTVNLIYTDDQGSKTIPVNINGTGAVPATGVLTTTSTSNYGENAQILRLTSGGINYSTTATACGTAGPMVGKLYLSTEAIQ